MLSAKITIGGPRFPPGFTPVEATTDSYLVASSLGSTGTRPGGDRTLRGGDVRIPLGLFFNKPLQKSLGWSMVCR